MIACKVTTDRKVFSSITFDSNIWKKVFFRRFVSRSAEC